MDNPYEMMNELLGISDIFKKMFKSMLSALFLIVSKTYTSLSMSAMAFDQSDITRLDTYGLMGKCMRNTATGDLEPYCVCRRTRISI
jgi:hypothetical protein